MRFLSILAVCLLLTAPAYAAKHKPVAHPAPAQPAGPRPMGAFQDWQAATHQEGGQTVCYAFTRAKTGKDTVLTVTQRPGGRDAVAISTDFPFANNATTTLSVNGHQLDLYTAQRSAFARDGHAAVVAFQHAAQLTARLPGAHGGYTDQNFSLRGFDRAYAATLKACPL